ncbi:hypothetical protein [Ileibacterium valens]|uniref:hypothetical protein n=1 Tax=Ileibacterium valens TaxID=1862668 RepID=UPI0025B79333|nr:hypothetical protein [Ileibacterium valens]
MKSLKTIRLITLYSCLGALIFALKMVMAPFPNIEPVTLMVIVLGSTLGIQSIWAILIYILCEVLTWGANIWVLNYLYLWPLLLVISCLLRKSNSAFVYACTVALFGYCFGAFCAIPMIFISGISGAIAWWQSGVLFDLIHGTSNFILVLILYRPLHKVLSELLNRFIQLKNSAIR